MHEYQYDNPALELLTLLDSQGLTVATAESCTGGNIAHLITSIPGSSSAMMGGVVAYSNQVKISILGVSAADIERYGAVSIPVVEQMAQGAQRAIGAQIAMATSGIAGPGGATPDKPVGTVCIAVATTHEVISQTCHFNGNRTSVIEQASKKAIAMAIQAISQKDNQ